MLIAIAIITRGGMDMNTRYKEEAQRNFSHSCNICCTHGIKIECDRCCIANCYNLVMAMFTDKVKEQPYK